MSLQDQYLQAEAVLRKAEADEAPPPTPLPFVSTPYGNSLQKTFQDYEYWTYQTIITWRELTDVASAAGSTQKTFPEPVKQIRILNEDAANTLFANWQGGPAAPVATTTVRIRPGEERTFTVLGIMQIQFTASGAGSTSYRLTYGS